MNVWYISEKGWHIVLVFTGTELIFFIVASMGLCFGKTVWIIQGCFSDRWAVLTLCQGLFCFSGHPSSEQTGGAQVVGRGRSWDSWPRLTKGVVYPQQVYWWHKTGRSGGYTRRLCCHPARPGQAGELGGEEPDELQQGQMQGPASGEEWPIAPVQAWGSPAGKQLCGERPGSAGGRQVDHEPAVCPGCQEGQC